MQKDQIGREFLLNEIPNRIISVVPSQTELLYDLGLENKIVGITKFCIHPSIIYQNKTHVGGTKKLNTEKIIALNPDLIIANKEENTESDILLLSKKIPVWVSDIKNIDDACNMILALGKICDVENIAQNLYLHIKNNIDKKKTTIKKSAVYLIWNNPIMTVGSDTYINEMMDIAGFYNLISLKRYPEISIEYLKSLSPQYLLLSSEPYPFKEKHITYFSTLLPNTKIILVDGEMFSWYGSRILKSFSYFEQLQKSIL